MAAVVVLMAVFWITEVVPIAVTALLPLALYPRYWVLPPASRLPWPTATTYSFFLGGCLIAAGLQKWNLHRRIALSIILWIGADLKRIMMGFMLATAFLSTWISNTATTLMMWPVALAVVVELAQSDAQGRIERSFGTVLMLAIAYGASVGGMSTLIGTGPNVARSAALIRELFPDSPEIGFTTWMALALPLTAVFLPIIWLVLLRYAAYWGLGQIAIPVEAARRVVSDKLAELGRPGRGEKTIAVAKTMPAALAASCAFMLPVATPPNAIVFASGWIDIRQMAQVGIVLNVLGILLVTAMSYAELYFILGIDSEAFPAWAERSASGH